MKITPFDKAFLSSTEDFDFANNSPFDEADEDRPGYWFETKDIAPSVMAGKFVPHVDFIENGTTEFWKQHGIDIATGTKITPVVMKKLVAVLSDPDIADEVELDLAGQFGLAHEFNGKIFTPRGGVTITDIVS